MANKITSLQHPKKSVYVYIYCFLLEELPPCVTWEVLKGFFFCPLHMPQNQIFLIKCEGPTS